MTSYTAIDRPQVKSTFLQYKCRRHRPAIRMLLLGGTGLLAFTMVLGDTTDAAQISWWIRLIPLAAMAMLTALMWRPIGDQALQLGTLGHAMALFVGLLMDDVTRRHGVLFAAPALIITGVASPMIWVRPALLMAGELLTATTMAAVLAWADIPAWLKMHLAIFMALSLAAGGLLYLVTNRLSYQNFRLESQLSQSAYTDELTGLANRRRALQMARRIFARCQTEHAPFSVLYIDADRFKEINDGFGHERGDTVLRHLAQLIEHAVRPTDLVGRLGGEEFIVILPGASHDDAIEIAERIRSSAASSSLGDLTVTVSIGVATSHDNDDFRMVLNAADANALLAKRNGRNRIEAAMPTQGGRN